MKQLFLSLLCVGLTGSMMAVAQDPSSVVTIDLDKDGKFFADGGTIPQGQKIRLKGKEGKAVFQKIDIEVSTFNGKQSFSAKINDEDWELEIGPFQPRQLITLTVKALRKTGNDSKIGELLSDGLNNTMPVINTEFDKRGGIDANALRNLFFSTLKAKLGKSTDNYFIDTDKKLIDNLRAVIDTNCLFSTAGNSCSNGELLSILRGISTGRADVKKYSDLKTKIEDSLAVFKDRFNAKMDSLNKKTNTDAINNQITTLKVKFIADTTRLDISKKDADSEETSGKNLKEKGEKELDKFTKDLTAKIKFNLIVSTLPVSSVDLRASGVEYYAGFDVSALAFDKELGATGLYFTISPYVFGKFDPELDYSDVKKAIPAKVEKLLPDSTKNPEWKKINKQRCKLICQNIASWLKYHISPTGGIAFSGNADIPNSPQLFAGGSLRINRLFKITAGSVFYRDPNSVGGKKYIHNFSLGMSLNISYFGTVMQMLGNATRSTKNQ